MMNIQRNTPALSRSRSLLAVAVTALMLSGCKTLEEGGAENATEPATTLSSSARELAIQKQQQDLDEKSNEPVMFAGSGKTVNMPPEVKPVRFVGQDVSLNFEQAPLQEVVHAVLGDILGLDYIVDHPIRGEITLRTRTPVPRDQVFDILESLLKANGALIVRGSDGRYIVSGSKEMQGLYPSYRSAGALGPGYSNIVIPLQYISATSMSEILKPVASDDAFVRIDNPRNLLILGGTRAQLEGWLDIINTFDVDLLDAMSVGIFPIEHTPINEVLSNLRELMGSGESAANAAKKGAAVTTLNISSIRLIPIDRLNSIMVLAPHEHQLKTVKQWIERLDQLPKFGNERKLYVYPVQNTTASRLANLLNSVFPQDEFNPTGSTGATGAGTAPGLTPETLSSNDNRSASGMNNSSSSNSGGGVSSGSGFANSGKNKNSTAQVTLGRVRVVADEENNSLMIYANKTEYTKIEDALEQLDVVANQVLIEASILEVTLTDDLEYGVEWTFDNKINNKYRGEGLLSFGRSASDLVGGANGFSYTIADNLGNVTAVLNALSEESLINVISTPSVMVLDNYEAYIHVGDQVPIKSGSTTTDGGNVTENIQYRDTGVKLSVRPSVNAGGLVTLDIEQSVTDVGTVDAATGQRSFLERNISSRVSVRSNEAVVLGGLIRENSTQGKSGVPLLHKLPLVGPLFGKTEDSDRKTELLVIITPKVLENQAQLRALTDEMRSQMRSMELLLNDEDIF